MMKIAWMTDIHLNFVDPSKRDAFLGELSRLSADAFLIGGDIGEAPSVGDYLMLLSAALDVPIFFVLGNHDFYGGSIAQVRGEIQSLCQQHQRLHYLSREGPQPLDGTAGLIGHDGWADGRAGDYRKSTVLLNDYRLIAEFVGADKVRRLDVMRELGDAAARHIQTHLPAALARFGHVFLLTHVPPFREACWHEGNISDSNWSPHFTCQAMGRVILEQMSRHPDKRLTVLCGHTHSSGQYDPLENVSVITGSAEYGAPAVARVWEIG